MSCKIFSVFGVIINKHIFLLVIFHMRLRTYKYLYFHLYGSSKQEHPQIRFLGFCFINVFPLDFYLVS